MLDAGAIVPNSVKSVLHLLSQNSHGAGRITRGKVGKCARDMVGECRRCQKIVCRVSFLESLSVTSRKKKENPLRFDEKELYNQAPFSDSHKGTDTPSLSILL